MKSLPLWVIVLGVVLLAGGGAVVYSATRGLRNNNPGNIIHSSDKWDGMSPVQNDPDFISFVKPEYGIRALYRTLMTKKNSGLNTIAKIINSWAPQFNAAGLQINDTPAYIDDVARRLNFNPNNELPLAAYPDLLKAIIAHENGLNPYPDSLIKKGIALA